MQRITTGLLMAALIAAPMAMVAPRAFARVDIGIGISVGVPPPALPVYAQPIMPGPGYLWTPGYWAWDPAVGYYWVPGTWVLPPQPGLLWTPGWWGWSAGLYRWYPGYWGPRVGFYGGVNYGFGYFGTGYVGGYWRDNRFFYNRAVNNINVTNVRNVYVDRTVIRNVNVNRVSYNGGRGGLAVQPTAAQRNYASQRHFQPTSVQTQQREMAMRNPEQRFNANRGRPAVFATQRPGQFDGQHAVRTPGAPESRMVAAPERARGMAGAPGQGRGVVEAPRDRPRGPGNSFQPAPNRLPRRVEAPRNGERPMPTAERPMGGPQGYPAPQREMRPRGPAEPYGQRAEPAARRGGQPPRGGENRGGRPHNPPGDSGH